MGKSRRHSQTTVADELDVSLDLDIEDIIDLGDPSHVEDKTPEKEPEPPKAAKAVTKKQKTLRTKPVSTSDEKRRVEARDYQVRQGNKEVTEEWYELVSGKLRRRQRAKSGGVYSTLVAMASDEPALVAKLKAQGLIRHN